MIVRFVFFIIFLLLLNTLCAQQHISASDYVRAQAGDTLVYEVSVGQVMSSDTLIYQETNFRNQLVLKCIESGRDKQFQKWTEKGLEVYLLATKEGRVLLPNRPLVFLPSDPIIRQVYRDSTSCAELLNGTKQGAIQLLVETQIEGFMSAETPLKNFVDCLILNTTIVQRKPNAPATIWEWKEWYAKGIGLVKAILRHHVSDKNNKSTALKIRMLHLTKASLGGKLVEGRSKH